MSGPDRRHSTRTALQKSIENLGKPVRSNYQAGPQEIANADVSGRSRKRAGPLSLPACATVGG